MNEKQKTIRKDIALSGIGLHTGSHVNLTLKPAAADTGIRFIRLDLPHHPVIKADLASVLSVERVSRCTCIGRNEEMIYTIEHFMSVLHGLGIDNLTVEIHGNELPGLDGSGLGYLKAIEEAGIVEQDAAKNVFDIKEPVGVHQGDTSIYIFPNPEFKVSYTLDYRNPVLRSQFFSTVVNEAIFKKEIASCRTFCLEEEAKELQTKGLGKGANYTNTLVVGEKGVIQNKVHFPDEFVRHKILDLIGDLYLLGMPIRGHVFAVKSGHRMNLELLKKIHEQKERYEKRGFVPKCDWGDKRQFDVQDIMKVLPHRYPFLLVDRVIEMEKGKRGVGIKNVTINDNFFQGHFPTRPVMPGVLMVEAMAQAAGVVVLTNEEHRGKVAFFMSADNVKFRKVVYPGDQLLLEVEVLSDKARSAKIRAQAKVGEEVVAEADMFFSFTDASFLD